MHKLIVLLAGTIFGFVTKTVIDEMEKSAEDDLITAPNMQPDSLGDGETKNAVESVETDSEFQTP